MRELTAPSPWGLQWAVWATEGSTVFFRGANGFYEAWAITDIHPSPGGGYPPLLEDTWWFQDDGSANFTPESATLALLAAGGLKLLRRKRR